jgi:hypothetical protein
VIKSTGERSEGHASWWKIEEPLGRAGNDVRSLRHMCCEEQCAPYQTIESFLPSMLPGEPRLINCKALTMFMLSFQQATGDAPGKIAARRLLLVMDIALAPPMGDDREKVHVRQHQDHKRNRRSEEQTYSLFPSVHPSSLPLLISSHPFP